MSKHQPKPELQKKLRQMVETESLFAVSERMGIGREVLARYLANLPMFTSTFRGVEATLASMSVDADAAGRP
jgi:Zn-dependent peptidase ImmA (M78 family)